MATAALTPLITAEEYLRTSYEPDADFVEGRIETRAMGERDHSAIQKRLLVLLSHVSMGASFECFPELRLQVAPERFRVPDLCLLAADAPIEQIVTIPPLLCIEILSPEDTMRRTLSKVDDFLAMGVAEVWVVDSEARAIHVCTGRLISRKSAGTLSVPGTTFEVQLAEIFAVLTPVSLP